MLCFVAGTLASIMTGPAAINKSMVLAGVATNLSEQKQKLWKSTTPTVVVKLYKPTTPTASYLLTTSHQVYFNGMFRCRHLQPPPLK
jgi:hypothetical protein